jgi:hypothetical protein
MDTVVLQINKRAGDYNALVIIPFTKSDKLTIGDAWIEDNNGKVVRKLKQNEIKEYSAVSNFSLYEDDFIKSFELKHNTYPYKIKYSFKLISTSFINIAHWCPAYTNKQPVRNKKLVVSVPVNYEIRYQQHYVNPPVKKIMGDNQQLIWDSISYVPVNRQKDAPVSSLKLPSITVVPINFKYGKQGSWETWETFGDWIYSLNENAGELPDSEKIKINQLLYGLSDTREKVQVLYRYLQDYTRYINVKIDIGGLKSYPADYVVKNKYGDCKALCTYMKAMLSYVGILSYYTLINSGDEVLEIDKTFPAQVFDHVILTVLFENDTVFLECTNKNAPFGYLGTFTQGREAFMIDANGKSRFISTPSLSVEDILCTRKITSSITSLSGQFSVNVDMNLKGSDYEIYTQLLTNLNRNVVEKYLRNYVMSGTFELLDFKFENESRDFAGINLNATFTTRDIVKRYGDKTGMSLYPHELTVYESPDKRTQPIQLHYPVSYIDTIEYTFETPVEESSPFNAVSEVSKFGHYVINGKYADGKYIVVKNIYINKGYYPLSEYEEFYKFLINIRKNERKNIFIRQL